MRKILLIAWLILIVCRPAGANPVTIMGVGQVELDQKIKLTESYDKKGQINYGFTVKDGAVWRGAYLMPISKLPANEISNMIKTDALLDHIIQEKFSKDQNTLYTEKSKQLTLGTKECVTATIKMTMPGAFFVVNTEMIIVSGADGLNLFAFMCADSDAQYWRPIMQKIAARIP